MNTKLNNCMAFGSSHALSGSPPNGGLTTFILAESHQKEVVSDLYFHSLTATHSVVTDKPYSETRHRGKRGQDRGEGVANEYVIGASCVMEWLPA